MNRGAWLEYAARALIWLGWLSVAAYALALVSVIRPWGGALGAYFAPRAILFLYVPFFFNGLAFYARVRLGPTLLDLGAAERAERWARPRIEPHALLRSKREALVHRVTLGRARLMQNDARGSLLILQGAPGSLPRRAPELVALARWRLEAGERLARLPQAPLESPPARRAAARERAAFHACVSEWHARSARWAEARESIERARWLDPSAARVRLAAARLTWLGVQEGAEDEWDEVDWARATREVPGREAELWVARADLAAHRGDGERARAYRARALSLIEEGAADERSASVWAEREARPTQEES